jgi:hypothetical protein
MAKPWLTRANGLSLIAVLAHFPVGVAWIAWRMPGKIAHNLIRGFSRAYDAAWDALHDLSRELDYRTTSQMLVEWETALGLPDACLPAAGTIEERRQWIRFRLDKRRWNTIADWYELADLFGLRVRITPGFVVQRPALFQVIFPKPFYAFPKLGRFRVYIDLLDQKFGGFPYDGQSVEYDKFPIPFGGSSEYASQFRCLIERVAPANVLIIWNAFPAVPPNGNSITFSDDFDEEYS